MQDDVTVHDLKCTIVVAQEGSLSRAATRLHMTQPALGRRVHHVEAEVGVRLFYSWYGGLRLTESGKVFIEDILQSVDHFERAAQRARNVTHRQDGIFQIAYSSFLSPELMAIVSDLHFDRPNDPVIRCTSLHTLGIIRGVLEGLYQVGIGYLPNSYSELEARELLDEDLMLCIPAHHRLFRSSSIAPQDLDRVFCAEAEVGATSAASAGATIAARWDRSHLGTYLSMTPHPRVTSCFLTTKLPP